MCPMETKEFGNQDWSEYNRIMSDKYAKIRQEYHTELEKRKNGAPYTQSIADVIGCTTDEIGEAFAPWNDDEED